MSAFRTIQGCPVHADIAPYIAICLLDCGAVVNSIYRGSDAAAILHRHGKHSQAELYQLFLDGAGNPANPPGFSSHELRSDGVAYPVARGEPLAWWQQGFDVNDTDVERVIAAGARYGWQLHRPYSSGSEFHHLNFRIQPPRPRAATRLWARLWRLRATLPRS